VNLLVCGSRSIVDHDLVWEELCDFVVEHRPTIIHGGAEGVDSIAAEIALDCDLEAKELKPNWEQYGKKAGMLRNETMVRMADVVWAFWDGESKGTKNSIDWALKLKKNLHVVFFELQKKRGSE
jgi:hypothetical protein